MSAIGAPSTRPRGRRARGGAIATTALVFTAIVAFGACASDPGKSTSIPGGDAGETDVVRVCTACDDAGSSAGRCVRSVGVELREADGSPVRDFAVSCCGRDLCVYARTDASGKATIRVCHRIDTPTFKLLGGRSVVSFAAPLRAGETVDVPPVALTRFSQAGAAFPSAGQAASVTSGDVSVEVGAPTQVKVSDLDHPEPDDRLFRAARIASGGVPEGLVPQGERIDLLFGLTPSGTVLTPPAIMTFPNALGWAAGSKADVLVHGLEIDDAFAPFGGWKVVTTATVTADGKTLRTDQGVPVLSIVGLRAR